MEAEISTQVVDVREEGVGAKTIRLAVPPDFSFTPGMWVMVQFPDKREHAGAYSISTSPFEKGYIEISLCKAGALSERLYCLRGDETLLLRGPYGKWIYHDDVGHAVLISDGTGVTPFRSMARYALAKKLPNKITILYSTRTPGSFLYRDELERFKASGIDVYLTVTHPEEAAGQAWNGPRGPIDIGVIERQVPGFSKAVYYLCGPQGLVENLTSELLKRRVPQNHIRYEKWGDYAWA